MMVHKVNKFNSYQLRKGTVAIITEGICANSYCGFLTNIVKS